MNKKKILLIGSSVMELSLNMFRLPDVGESVTDDGGVAYLPGGGATGVAVALSRLGADCVFCSKLGADSHGQSLYEHYRDMGINTSAIKVDHDYPTGLTVILREGNGTERRILYPGANENLTVENIAEAFAEQPDAMILDPTIPAAAAAAAGKIASVKGIPICICPAGGVSAPAFDALPAAEILVMDEATAERLTDIRPSGAESSLRCALAAYRKVHTHYLMIRLSGMRGTFYYDGKHYGMVPIVGNVRHPQDISNLDDAYFASLVLGYLVGGDIKSAIQLGESALALCALAGGGVKGFPTTTEVYQFLSKNR